MAWPLYSISFFSKNLLNDFSVNDPPKSDVHSVQSLISTYISYSFYALRKREYFEWSKPTLKVLSVLDRYFTILINEL